MVPVRRQGQSVGFQPRIAFTFPGSALGYPNLEDESIFHFLRSATVLPFSLIIAHPDGKPHTLLRHALQVTKNGGDMGRSRSFLWMVFFALVLSACATDDARLGPIVLTPGDDVAEMVANAPEGAVFEFRSGIYRVGSIFPKDGQRFTGEASSVISGAVLLENWTRSGEFWSHESAPYPLPQHGVCERDESLCARRENLFINGKRMRRVARSLDVKPGHWHYSPENGRIYIRDDPADNLMEFSVADAAVTGKAKNIRIETLRFEKYAGPAAIDGRRGRGWVLKDVTAAWNHGAGVLIGDEMTIVGGRFISNGQAGIGGGGKAVRIDGVEIAHNNTAGFDRGTAAAGARFSEVRDLIVRNSCIHNNDGAGLWTASRAMETLYDGNIIFANTGDGIRHENAFDATIRRNRLAGNGSGSHDWLWGAQILIQNSSNVEVYKNVLETPAGGGNGISIVFHERPDERKHAKAKDNYIHGNTIILRGEHSRTGMAADHDRKWFWRKANNLFENNTYAVSAQNRKFWGLNNRFRTWDYVQRNGQEAGSELSTDQPEPLTLSCDMIEHQK